MAMVVFALPSIPETVYRIQSADRLGPPLYLERQSNGEITAALLDTANTNQQWRVVYQDDGTYRIVNAKSYEGLSLQKDQTDFRLWSGGPQQVWTFEARGDVFIIGDPATTSCLDVQPNNRVVSQVRTNAVSQRWILHTMQPDSTTATKSQSDNTNVKPNTDRYQADHVPEDGSAGWKKASFLAESPPAPRPALPPLPSPAAPRLPTPAPTPVSTPTLANGNYDIINVASGHPYYRKNHHDFFSHHIWFMRTKDNIRPPDFSSWSVESVPGSPSTYRITAGSLYGRPLSLLKIQFDETWDGSVEVPSDGDQTCRLIPAISPGCFHLAEPDDGSGVIKVAARSSKESWERDTIATGAYFSAEDKRQHWRFVPV